MECVPPSGDELYIIWKCYARQASAVFECSIPDAGHAVRNDDAGQAATVLECVIAEDDDTVGNGNARQASAATE